VPNRAIVSVISNLFFQTHKSVEPGSAYFPVALFLVESSRRFRELGSENHIGHRPTDRLLLCELQNLDNAD
jgi:hypothetical protein